MPPLPSGRAAVAARIVEAIGEAVVPLAIGDGWPARIQLRLSDGGSQLVALYAAPITSMARAIPGEIRFQNPGTGRPVERLPGELPLLVGLSDTPPPPVLVVPETERRVGLLTRFSVRFRQDLVDEARQHGWAEPFVSNSGERFWAFHPALLPAFVEAQTDGVELPTEPMLDVVSGAGLSEDDSPDARERARRSATQLVRDARFRRRVVDAYRSQCAMCGLGLGLVVAAHILPATAPGSPDTIANGLALCPNHHALFDAHAIYVEPETLRVVLRPDVVAPSAGIDAAFLETTLGTVAAPQSVGDRPQPAMFDARYTYFEGEYGWARG